MRLSLLFFILDIFVFVCSVLSALQKLLQGLSQKFKLTAFYTSCRHDVIRIRVYTDQAELTEVILVPFNRLSSAIKSIDHNHHRQYF